MNIVRPPLKIVHYPHPALRYHARPLRHIDTDVKYAAEAMLHLMYESAGLGLAAPQVGLPIQLLVMNYAGDHEQPEQQHVVINPVILDKKGTMEGDEGCLSFPKLFQKVRRARTVRVEGYDLEGNRIEAELTDLPSRIWQHEVDHLHGILFIDKMGPVGKLAARSSLQKFEQDYHKAQQKGEIPSDEAIQAQLDEMARLVDGR